MPDLEAIAEQVRRDLSVQDAAREAALPLSRETIRNCSQGIRAIHRQEFDTARKLLQAADTLMRQAQQAVAPHGELSHAGFIRDAEKEFAEGMITLALITGDRLPRPGDLEVTPAAYLNGLGEAVGEMRRYLLDSIRRGDLSPTEEMLSVMDDIYSVLTAVDFPDAITGGLRRTTDMVRGVLERTRSDLTLVIRQKTLEEKLGRFEGNL